MSKPFISIPESADSTDAFIAVESAVPTAPPKLGGNSQKMPIQIKTAKETTPEPIAQAMPGMPRRADSGSGAGSGGKGSSIFAVTVGAAESSARRRSK